jgi:hypothetical protein
MFSSPDIITMTSSDSMKWALCAAYVGEMGYKYFFEGKPERKRLLGQHRPTEKDNIKLDLYAIVWSMWS